MKITKNPNKEVFEKVSQAVKDNQGYCCCAVEKTPDTKCMCKEFLEGNEIGECHCGRYVKTEL